MTEEQIRTEWIPKLLQEFQEFMLPIDREYPKIYFTNDKTFNEVFSLVNASIEIINPAIASFSFAEYMPGNLGNAILIHTDNIDEDYYPDFAMSFWMKLAYFYTTTAVPDELLELYLMNEDEWDMYHERHNVSPDLVYLREGCQIWFPFVAKAIAEILSKKYSMPDIAYPEQDELNHIFNNEAISEEHIGTYFALTLTKTVDENAVSMPKEISYCIKKLKEVMEAQFQKERFWDIDTNTIQKIGSTYLNAVIKVYIEKPVAQISAESKKKQKSKRKAQKQARKRNRK